MREVLRVPRCPEAYHFRRVCVGTRLTRDTFVRFVWQLHNADLIKKSNTRALIKYADPFLCGTPLQLGNGQTLAGDHTVTLQDDLFAKLKEVRAFEKENDDASHGYLSHVLGKLALMQLQEMGDWSIPAEQTARQSRRAAKQSAPQKRKWVAPTVTPVAVPVPYDTQDDLDKGDSDTCGQKGQPPIAVVIAHTVANPVAFTVKLAPPPPLLPPLLPPPLLPPPAYQQLARTCALDLGLHGYLGKRMGKTLAREEVKKYYKRNPEQVKAAGLDPELFSIDHVVPSHIGGLDHVFNFVLMPVGTNARFKDRWDFEKKKYVGKNAEKIASEFASWFRSRNAAMEDFSKFDPHRCL